MGRSWQIFAAPDGRVPSELPTEASPWHYEGWARIPEEHWHLLLDHLATWDADAAKLIRRLSFNPRFEEEDRIDASPDELEQMIRSLEALSRHLADALPLVPQASEEVPDAYVNEEHVRMIAAVKVVASEALRLGRPFRAWID